MYCASVDLRVGLPPRPWSAAQSASKDEGGEGEGLIAFNYAVKGSYDDPKVSVNPLSALTPGFLRGIFNAGEAKKPEENGVNTAPNKNITPYRN